MAAIKLPKLPAESEIEAKPRPHASLRDYIASGTKDGWQEL